MTSSDIDAARTAILLPNRSISGAEPGTFLLAQTGFELTGNRSLGLGGGLEYRMYGGHDLPRHQAPNPGVRSQPSDLNVPVVAGGRLDVGRRRSMACAWAKPPVPPLETHLMMPSNPRPGGRETSP